MINIEHFANKVKTEREAAVPSSRAQEHEVPLDTFGTKIQPTSSMNGRPDLALGVEGGTTESETRLLRAVGA